MNALTTLLPSILPVLVLIAGAFAPQVQGVVAAHPLLSILLATVASVLNHWLPSPKA